MANLDAPTVFQSAGYSAYKADWLSGVNDIFYSLSSLALFTSFENRLQS